MKKTNFNIIKKALMLAFFRAIFGLPPSILMKTEIMLIFHRSFVTTRKPFSGGSLRIQHSKLCACVKGGTSHIGGVGRRGITSTVSEGELKINGLEDLSTKGEMAFSYSPIPFLAPYEP
jgi:hypothetical protein